MSASYTVANFYCSEYNSPFDGGLAVDIRNACIPKLIT